MSSEARHVIAYTTFLDRAKAVALARSAVERQLVASVRVQEAISVRPIDGAVQEVSAWVVAMQTASPMIYALKAHILAQHNEDVPEFVVVPIVAANENYLDWVDDYVDERKSLQESAVVEPTALDRHEIDPQATGHRAN
jgi:uncharacterized protein involved in tolerance to divalent cations